MDGPTEGHSRAGSDAMAAGSDGHMHSCRSEGIASLPWEWNSGDVLLLTDPHSHVCVEFIVEVRTNANANTIVSLARPTSPYHRLVFTQNNKLVFKDTNDKTCFIRPVYVCAYDSNAHPGKHTHSSQRMAFRSSFRDAYIGLDGSGELVCVQTPVYYLVTVIRDYYNSKVRTCTTIAAATNNNRSHTDDFEASILEPAMPATQLSKQQLLQFYHYGYTQIPRIVQSHKIDVAVKMLNHYLGVPGALVLGGIQGQGLGKFEGGITRRQEIMALLEGELSDLIVNSLFTSQSVQGTIDTTALQTQIAFRFPELNSAYEHGAYTGEDTVDLSSFPWHTDGLRQGRSHSFTLLVGVCLQEISSAPLAGNLLIWPRTHRLLHSCKMNQYGALDLQRLKNALPHFIGCSGNEVSDEEIMLEFQEDQNRRRSMLPKPEKDAHVPFKDDAHKAPTIRTRVNDGFGDDETLAHHDNEPDNLPSLGNPLAVTMKAGVGNCLVDEHLL
jgi:hypothetical protein